MSNIEKLAFPLWPTLLNLKRVGHHEVKTIPGVENISKFVKRVKVECYIGVDVRYSNKRLPGVQIK
jgi:hypothetical protein